LVFWRGGGVRGIAPQNMAGLREQNTVSDTVQRWKTESEKSCIKCCERDEGTRNKKQKVGERDV
jgi:hypothetical protein